MIEKINSVPIAKIPYEENPFREIFVDVLWQCNMSCNMCYSDSPGPKFPVTSTSNVRISPAPATGASGNDIEWIPERLDLGHYEDFCARLPEPSVMALVGGEPTLRKDIFKILEITHKYGHMAFMATNGKRFAKSLQYTQEFAEVARKGQTRISIDISCGYDHEISDIIFNEDIVDTKQKALERILETRLGRVMITCVLIRGVNESAVPDLLDMSKKFRRVVRTVKLRAQGHVGRWIDETHPYQTQEMLELLEQHIDRELIYKDVTLGPGMDERCMGKTCCFHFKPWRGLEIDVLECYTDKGTCWRKGRLNDSGTVEPVFVSYEAMTKDMSIESYASTLTK